MVTNYYNAIKFYRYRQKYIVLSIYNEIALSTQKETSLVPSFKAKY